MAFNLNDYEMVKDRIPLFYEKYSDGRITCDIITENADWVTMKAFLWKDMESQVANAPLSTGIAREILGGFIDKYYENCETSAIGRALANLNMFDGNRPSREEMESAQSMQEARAMKQTVRPKPQAPSTPPPCLCSYATINSCTCNKDDGQVSDTWMRMVPDQEWLCPPCMCKWLQPRGR